MRDRDQVLAEIFDCLIKHDSGKIPSEVGELFSLGVRLHNECPDIDPGFKEELGCRLAREWSAPRVGGHAGPAGLLARAGLVKVGLALRPLAVVAFVVCLALASAAVFPPLRSTVEAGLGRVITVFHGAVVEQCPRAASTPLPTEFLAEFATIEEAEAAGYALRAPAYLPDGTSLRRVEIAKSGGVRRVVLHYAHTPDPDGPLFGDRRSAYLGDKTRPILIQQIATVRTPEKEALALQVGPDSVERLQVAGRTALWAAGRWSMAGRWIRQGKEGLLILQDGDLLLMVSSELGRDENVRIAESMLR